MLGESSLTIEENMSKIPKIFKLKKFEFKLIWVGQKILISSIILR